jgi:hypothetical protein
VSDHVPSILGFAFVYLWRWAMGFCEVSPWKLFCGDSADLLSFVASNHIIVLPF